MLFLWIGEADLSGPFKWCSSCSNKITLLDGHSQCIFCLGEEHQLAVCSACKSFMKPALKPRLQHLLSFLCEKSLCLVRDPTMDLPQAPPSETSLVAAHSLKLVKKATKVSSSGSRLTASASVLRPASTSVSKKKKRSSGKLSGAPAETLPSPPSLAHAQLELYASAYHWEMRICLL